MVQTPSSDPINVFVQAAVMLRRWGSLNNKLTFYDFRGQKSEIRVPEWWGSSEGLFLACRWLLSCVLTWPGWQGHREQILLSSLQRH